MCRRTAILKNICKVTGGKILKGYFQNVSSGHSGKMSAFLSLWYYSVFFTFPILNKGYFYNLLNIVYT